MPDIRIDTGATVRTITLSRPEKRNALTREMFETLTAAFEREPAAAERVTVLRAEGPSFCAGVDLGQRAANDAREGRSPLELLCAAIRRYPLPVVAVVQGHAIGGGMMLALSCDFVVAADDAKVGNGAVQMGLVPAFGLAREIAAVAGKALARELFLLGDPMPAARLGHALAGAVPAAELEVATDRVVARLAANAPLSMRAVKATLNAEPFAAAPHGRAQELIERAAASEDSREGVAARRERRPPAFAGI
jgi:enoyl-CoA hydratase/carnithine racemase